MNYELSGIDDVLRINSGFNILLINKHMAVIILISLDNGVRFT